MGLTEDLRLSPATCLQRGKHLATGAHMRYDVTEIFCQDENLPRIVNLPGNYR